MGIKVARQKPRHFLLSLAYRLYRYFPATRARKLDFLLDLEWIANRLAHETATSLGLTRHTRNHFLLDGIGPADRVLDLGCGTGAVAGQVKAAHVVGIDHDETILKIARVANPGVEFVCADARDYLASAPRFDVLILSHVLEHLDEPEAFLGSFVPQFDRIYVEVPDFDATLFNRIRADRGRQLVYNDNDHVSEFDRDEMEAMFTVADLLIEDSEFIHGNMRYWLVRKTLKSSS